MGERITIKEAVKRIERSERTIRQWLKDGRMQTYRVEGDKRNTILIDKHELLMAAAEMTPPPKKNMLVHRSKGEFNALHHHLEATERRLEVSEQRLDKAELDARNLRAEVARLQEALAAKTERIHALELELNGGVRGLLRKLNPLR